MTLTIENAIKVIKAMAKPFNAKVRVKKSNLEKELLNDEKEFEKVLKKGKIKTYKNA